MFFNLILDFWYSVHFTGKNVYLQLTSVDQIRDDMGLWAVICLRIISKINNIKLSKYDKFFITCF